MATLTQVQAPEHEVELLIPEVEQETHRRRRRHATRAGVALIVVAMVAVALVLAGVAGAGGDRGSPSPGASVSPLAVAGTLQPVGFPHTSAPTFLQHVSCASGTACIVVGELEGRTDYTNGAWRYSAGAWRRLASPVQTSRDGTGPLSCPTTSFCVMASNDWRSSRGAKLHAAVQVYAQGRWHEVRTPSPTHSYNDSLQAVDCISSSWCMALGVAQYSTGSTQAYADVFSGGSWALLSVPRSAGEARLGLEIGIGGVSCTSSTFCVAVGNAPDGEGSFAIADTYNGQVWSALPVPRLPKSELGRPGGELVRGKFRAFPWDQGLTGVACASSTDCTVSGEFWDQSMAETGGSFVMHFDGTVLTKVLLLAKGPILGHPRGVLGGLACPTASRCAAYVQAFNTLFLGTRVRYPVDALQLDSRGWFTSSWGYAKGQLTYASDISCLSSGRCLIVGSLERPSSPAPTQAPLVLSATARHF